MLDYRTNVLYNKDAMKKWERLFTKLGFKLGPGKNHKGLDEKYHSALEEIAFREQRPAREIQADLLAIGLSYHHTHSDLWSRWESLSPREKDVAALTCLGYTNRQIASKLQLSPDTIKGYVHQVLVKFRRHSKAELQLLLTDWDFSQWGTRSY